MNNTLSCSDDRFNKHVNFVYLMAWAEFCLNYHVQSYIMQHTLNEVSTCYYVPLLDSCSLSHIFSMMYLCSIILHCLCDITHHVPKVLVAINSKVKWVHLALFMQASYLLLHLVSVLQYQVGGVPSSYPDRYLYILLVQAVLYLEVHYTAQWRA